MSITSTTFSHSRATFEPLRDNIVDLVSSLTIVRLMLRAVVEGLGNEVGFRRVHSLVEYNEFDLSDVVLSAARLPLLFASEKS